MARGFDNISDNSKRDSLRESDIFEIYPLAKKAAGGWVSIRLLETDLLPIKKHWIKIMGGKDKDKEIKIPRLCVSFDPDNAGKPLRGMKCPYCGIAHGNDESGAPAQYDFKWYAQAIVRDEQETQPRKLPKHTKQELKTKKKEKGSESWTPVFCIPLTNSLAGRIKELGERNIHNVKDKKSGKKSKQAFQVNHPKYGCDIEIKYNAKKSPAERYSIERGEHKPLTEEEKEYLTWDFENWEEIYDLLGRLSEADALADFKKMDVLGVEPDDSDDDEDDDGMSLGKKGKKSKKSRKDDDDEDDEDDEDERPSKKSKKSKPSKSKRLLDDDEDDEDEDDEDEDDRPSKKSKKSSKDKKSVKSKKSKKSSRDDDDEDDEDDEDEKPKKKKKKTSSADKSSVKKKKKKSSDDDEDEKPKKKKKKK